MILELSNPELEKQAQDAESQARAAEAQLHRAQGAARRASCSTRRPRPRASRPSRGRPACGPTPTPSSHKNGLIADITLKLSQSAAEELEHREQIEQQRLAIAGEAIEAQLRVQQADVDQTRSQARLRRSQVEALHVRAGIDGVLQLVPVEVGQRVAPGTNLARVARPEKLKAEIRIPETQARDVVPGQKAVVDTRNGIVDGPRDPRRPGGPERHGDGRHRARSASCRKGARPDLTVDGTIELERLLDALHVGRPAMGQPQSTVGLFRIVKGTSEARAREGGAGAGVGQHDRDQGRARGRGRGDPLRHVGVGLGGPDPPELKRGRA